MRPALVPHRSGKGARQGPREREGHRVEVGRSAEPWEFRAEPDGVRESPTAAALSRGGCVCSRALLWKRLPPLSYHTDLQDRAPSRLQDSLSPFTGVARSSETTAENRLSPRGSPVDLGSERGGAGGAVYRAAADTETGPAREFGVDRTGSHCIGPDGKGPDRKKKKKKKKKAKTRLFAPRAAEHRHGPRRRGGHGPEPVLLFEKRLDDGGWERRGGWSYAGTGSGRDRASLSRVAAGQCTRLYESSFSTLAIRAHARRVRVWSFGAREWRGDAGFVAVFYFFFGGGLFRQGRRGRGGVVVPPTRTCRRRRRIISLRLPAQTARRAQTPPLPAPTPKRGLSRPRLAPRPLRPTRGKGRRGSATARAAHARSPRRPATGPLPPARCPTVSRSESSPPGGRSRGGQRRSVLPIGRGTPRAARGRGGQRAEGPSERATEEEAREAAARAGEGVRPPTAGLRNRGTPACPPPPPSVHPPAPSTPVHPGHGAGRDAPASRGGGELAGERPGRGVGRNSGRGWAAGLAAADWGGQAVVGAGEGRRLCSVRSPPAPAEAGRRPGDPPGDPPPRNRAPTPAAAAPARATDRAPREPSGPPPLGADRKGRGAAARGDAAPRAAAGAPAAGGGGGRRGGRAAPAAAGAIHGKGPARVQSRRRARARARRGRAATRAAPRPAAARAQPRFAPQPDRPSP
ncbi:uncharacterized protein [Patagioenas fasciata]|uniref:uncharacterized protein n=1 Tax=Patagioenas fasciata TaxID=372321 RepID=UPI003A990BD1